MRAVHRALARAARRPSPAGRALRRRCLAASAAAAAQPVGHGGGADEPVVVVSGLPRNPPRSLAFKLKELLNLRATPTLLRHPATTEAVLLTHSDADARSLRRVLARASGRAAARQPRASRRPMELGLGPALSLSLRAGGLPLGDPVDARPWGAHVMSPTDDSNLADGPPSEPPPGEEWWAARGVVPSATAIRVLRRGEPPTFTPALGQPSSKTPFCCRLPAVC
eukprot:COSAG04_NODE_355_length_16048_cov_133.443511_11_plen_224_part_00